MHSFPGLVAFDVDGTLLRGETVCECIGRHLGKSEEMTVIEQATTLEEVAAARRQMLTWYLPHGREAILEYVKDVRLAPGAKAAFARLRLLGIKTALVSITWKFAVEWLALELGADYAVGTDWADSGEVSDFWPDDKVAWLTVLLSELNATQDDLVAVGDSSGDIPMLGFARRGYFVGATLPAELPHVLHWPQADILSLVEHMLGEEPRIDDTVHTNRLEMPRSDNP